MSVDLVRIVDSIHRDKNIPKEVLFEGIESALTAAAKKRYPEAADVEVHVDPESGAIEAIRDGTRLDPAEFGRIAAQTAKQFIIQKIREAERDSLYDDFESQRGDLVTGTVQQFHGGAIIVNLGKTDGILPRGEQIPGESHHPNERIRAVILDVRKAGQRVKIILSRTHPDFVRRLFELEIPEIGDQTIAIRALAREAGYRSKVAVASIDAKIDAVGACVGVRGTRIKNIVDELGGERIDIVRWNESLTVLIPNALQPAEIDEVMLCTLLGRAIVLVRDDQLSLAIGRRGQNVRLASKLVGWDIEIMTAEELDEVIDKAVKTFEKIEGVDTDLAERLVEQGILSYDDLSVMEIDDLVNTIEGLTEERAIEIVARAEVLAEEPTEEVSPRRKSGRGAASMLEGQREPTTAPAEGAPVAQPGDSDLETAAPAAEPATEERLEEEEEEEIVSESQTDVDDSALPAEIRDEAEDHEALEPEAEAEIGDVGAAENGEEEPRDLALAEEEADQSPRGREVTSPPDDDDQGQAGQLLTDVIEGEETPPAVSDHRPAVSERRPEDQPED